MFVAFGKTFPFVSQVRDKRPRAHTQNPIRWISVCISRETNFNRDIGIKVSVGLYSTSVNLDESTPYNYSSRCIKCLSRYLSRSLSPSNRPPIGCAPILQRGFYICTVYLVRRASRINSAGRCATQLWKRFCMKRVARPARRRAAPNTSVSVRTLKGTRTRIIPRWWCWRWAIRTQRKRARMRAASICDRRPILSTSYSRISRTRHPWVGEKVILMPE